jgi:hypothetical protein
VNILWRRIRAQHTFIAIAVLVVATNIVMLEAHAASFQQTYLRLDRMAATTATGGTVCAQPATTATEAKIAVTFPSLPATFGVNATAANWTVTTTNLPTGATAWPGIGTATSVAGQIVTWPSSDLTVGTLYCFNFSGTNTLTNPAAANSYKGYITSQTAANAQIDQTYFGTAIISNDQISVTAVVPPIFIFTLSGNADSFPADLDPSIVNSTTAGIYGTITTNAKGGWIAWAKDSQQGLYSASVNYKINTIGTVDGTPSTLTPGSEAYQLVSSIKTDVAGGCQIAIQAEYAGTATSGGTFTSPFTQIAQCTGASPATSNGDQFNILERATISGATPAGTDYSDIITVVTAGNF